MKNKLPRFISSIIFGLVFILLFLQTVPRVSAALTPAPIPSTVEPTIDPAIQIVVPTTAPASSTNFMPDSEVNFVGKTGARSGEFLDWALKNYNWLCVKQINQNVCDNSDNPLISFWIMIRNIVYALIALFVLGTAFLLIITRGQNVTLMRFIPRFIMIVVLITFSFSLVQFIYQITDIIQGFFLRIPRVDPQKRPSHYNA